MNTVVTMTVGMFLLQQMSRHLDGFDTSMEDVVPLVDGLVAGLALRFGIDPAEMKTAEEWRARLIND